MSIFGRSILRVWRRSHVRKGLKSTRRLWRPWMARICWIVRRCRLWSVTGRMARTLRAGTPQNKSKPTKRKLTFTSFPTSTPSSPNKNASSKKPNSPLDCPSHPPRISNERTQSHPTRPKIHIKQWPLSVNPTKTSESCKCSSTTWNSNVTQNISWLPPMKAASWRNLWTWFISSRLRSFLCILIMNARVRWKRPKALPGRSWVRKINRTIV